MSKDKSVEKVEATTGPTPGAGVDPKRAIKPTKRLKKLYRAENPKASFKTWAKGLAAGGDKYAEAWLLNKSSGLTADARKERRSRVRLGRAVAQSKPTTGKKR